MSTEFVWNEPGWNGKVWVCISLNTMLIYLKRKLHYVQTISEWVSLNSQSTIQLKKCYDWFLGLWLQQFMNKGQKRALIQIILCQNISCNKNLKLYQIWMVWPYFPQGFDVLSSCPLCSMLLNTSNMLHLTKLQKGLMVLFAHNVLFTNLWAFITWQILKLGMDWTICVLKTLYSFKRYLSQSKVTLIKLYI